MTSQVGDRVFQSAVRDAGLLFRVDIDGLYGRNRVFETIVEGLNGLITEAASGDTPEQMHFPPVMPREHLERNGYFSAFPKLAGCVHCFMGDEADHRRLVGKLVCEEDAADEFRPTDLALVPAACYPVYPAVAARTAISDTGLLIEVVSYCFRHEPSGDLERQLCFRQHEIVRIGRPQDVEAFRMLWLERGKNICGALGLDGRISVANDPFFGSGSARLAEQQLASALKLEMLLPIGRDRGERACISLNAHQAHFAAIWGLRLPDGSLAHTACVGFGLERLTLALLERHGTDVAAWPADIRAKLRLPGPVA